MSLYRPRNHVLWNLTPDNKLQPSLVLHYWVISKTDTHNAQISASLETCSIEISQSRKCSYSWCSCKMPVQSIYASKSIMPQHTSSQIRQCSSVCENYTSNTTDRWTCILITYGHCITNATVTIHYTDGCLYATCTQLVTAKHSIQSYGWMQSTDSGSLNVSQNGDCSQNYNLEITQHKFHKTSIRGRTTTNWDDATRVSAYIIF